MAALRADSALMARCPDGVFYRVAKPGAAACVIVDRFDHVVNANLFAPWADETFTYVVTAVLPDTDATAAREAALRIRTVLDGHERRLCLATAHPGRAKPALAGTESGECRSVCATLGRALFAGRLTAHVTEGERYALSWQKGLGQTRRQCRPEPQ